MGVPAFSSRVPAGSSAGAALPLWTRGPAAGPPARATTFAPATARSQRLASSGAWPLLRLGGRGEQADADAVARRLARVPPALLQAAGAAGLRVVACRGAVTDHLVGYRGYQAPGWPQGWKYDHLPGIYLPDHRTVVIATTVTTSGTRAVPRRGLRHDSFDLTLHEFGHAVDRLGLLDGQGSRGAGFIACYRADLGHLAAAGERHLAQGGLVGLQEAYGESFARYFGGDPSLERVAPNLHAYWKWVAGALGWSVTPVAPRGWSPSSR